MTTDIPLIATMAVPRSGDGLRAFSAPVTAPPPQLPASPPELPEAPVELAKALDEIAARVRQAGAEIDFQVDDDSGRVIVRIVDRHDGTVLRQMPSEEALRIAQALARNEAHLIDARA